MDAWRSLTMGNIRRDDAGRMVFYPHGLLGRGYELPPDGRTRLLSWTWVFLVYGGILGITWIATSRDPLRLVSAIAILIALNLLWIRWATRTLIPLEGSRSFRERIRDRAIQVPPGYHWFGVVAGFLFAGVSLVVLVLGPWPRALVGLPGLILFGATGVVSLRMLVYRWGADRSDD